MLKNRYKIKLVDIMTLLSLWVAMMIQLLPMSDWLYAMKPDMVAMVWLYWVLAMPASRGMKGAFFLSLWMDVLIGYPFGTHGLGFIVLTFIAVKFHLQIRMFPIWQQSMVVALILFIERTLYFLVSAFLIPEVSWISLFTVVITHTLLWPWLYHLLRVIRQSSTAN